MFWETLNTFEQIMFCVGVIASVVLVIQIILLLIGFFDFDVDIDIDATDGVGLFTIKGLIAFFALGGWVSFGVSMAGVAWWWSLLAGIAAGLAGLVGVGYLYKLGMKLQANGTLQPEKSIDKVAEVYLTIPPANGGNGKISIEVNGKLEVMDAITTEDEAIKTGEFVKITDWNGEKFIVEKLKNNKEKIDV